MINPNFVVKQGRVLDETIRENARLNKRLAELLAANEAKARIIGKLLAVVDEHRYMCDDASKLDAVMDDVCGD